MKKIICIFISLIIICMSACVNSTNVDETTTLTEQNSTTNTVIQATATPETEYTTVVIKTSPEDPYSYLIKERYDRIIEDYKRPIQTLSNLYYALYDIDGNGIEELLLGEEYVIGGIQNVEPGEPYEEGVTFFHIYTIQDGVAVEQDLRLWWCGETLLERSILSNGLVRASGRIENPSYCYFKFVDGKLEYQESLSTEGGKYAYVYDDNGNEVEKEITKTEFDRLREEIENGAQPVEINWKRIDEYGK